ncbi:hypothetical protein [Flexivirga meconopsidis]|uniref:hypothetical protein n=1 Tax=Flexivirga meconopsidis TaxID=2977121 RepID=UPI00223E9B35|nr:hypothetical protein [Flexivirga meconopsidis]
MATTPTATVAELTKLLARHDSAPVTAGVPVHEVFADIFPHGLRSGAVYSLRGSMTAALALLAGPSLAGSWCGVVGVPDLGVEAAAEWGVQLDRLALVPRFDPADWTTVIAALAEVTALVVAAPPDRISPGEVSRLLARLRTSGSTLVVLGPWPRAVAELTGQVVEWRGLHQGHGHLSAGRVRLEVTERHRRRQAEFAVPVRP